MATILIEGQRLQLDDQIALDDEKLRAALSQFFPEAANATFSRQTKEGELTVSVFKRAGTKGTGGRHNPTPATPTSTTSASNPTSASTPNPTPILTSEKVALLEVALPETPSKQAAHKAGLSAALELLRQIPEEIHPARLLAWELEEKCLSGTLSVAFLLPRQVELEETAKAASVELEAVGKILQSLQKAAPVPASHTPEGF